MQTNEENARDVDLLLGELIAMTDHRRDDFWSDINDKLLALRPGVRRHMSESDRGGQL